MKYCWTTIYVKDLQKSIEFYHGVLGLEIRERFKTDELTEIVMLGKEKGVMVELIDNNAFSVKSVGISMGFEVEALDEALKQMDRNGILIKNGPFSPTPTLKFFFVEDPNGVEIQIVQNTH